MNTFPHNLPVRHVPEIVVLDFDRTLSDVAAGMRRLYVAASAYGIDSTQVEAARKRTEDDGGTFEPLSIMQGSLAPSDFTGFKAAFTGQDGSPASKTDILYPDARRLLARLLEAGTPFIVITYGVSREWQELKIEAAGWPVDYIITDTPRKTDAVLSLRKADGQFELRTTARDDALYRAPSLRFVDDKAQAFEGFPQDEAYQGFWLQRGTLLPSQQGTVPDNVRIIRTLDDLIVGRPPNDN